MRFAAKQRSGANARISYANISNARNSSERCRKINVHAQKIPFANLRVCGVGARERARGEESRKIYNVHHVLSSIYFIYFDMRTHTFFSQPRRLMYRVRCARVRIKINIGIKM